MQDTTNLSRERRFAPRLLGNRICHARPDRSAAGLLWGATLHDLSTHGLGLLLRCKLAPGTLLVVQPLRGSRTPLLFERVVHAQPHRRRWLHGCQLAQPLTADELQLWLAEGA